MPCDTDAAHFHEALTPARLGVQITQIPAAIVFGLVENETRIAPLDLILACKSVLSALNVRFEDQGFVADGPVEEDTGRVDIAGGVAALNGQIGVQIGRESFRRLFRCIRPSTLKQHFGQAFGRVDPQHQNGQLLRIIVQLNARGVDFLGRKGFDPCQRRRQLRLRLFGQQRTDQCLEALAVDDEPVVAGQQHGQFAQHPTIEVQRHGDRDVAIIGVDVRTRPRILRRRGDGRRSCGLSRRRLRIGWSRDRRRNLRRFLIGLEIARRRTQRRLAGQADDQSPGRRRQKQSPPEPHRVNRTVMGLDGSSWMPPVGTLKTRRPPAGAR